MTGTEGTAQGPSAGSGLEASRDPSHPQDPVAAHGLAIVAPRRRRRWAVLILTAVAVLGLAAGLVIWAPWVPPPVLRPTGLVAGTSTANSVAFRWSRPLTGPLPDRYLIVSYGKVSGSLAGTVTSYRQAGLTPATPYLYRVVAVRGGKRSVPSALLTVSTLTPPVSQARLEGSWGVSAKNIGSARGGKNGFLSWNFSPACAAGVCDVILRGQDGTRASFKMKLTRAGAVYAGQTVANGFSCGSGADTIPDSATLKIRIHVIGAIGEKQAWDATAFAGTMVGTYHYASSGTVYCPRFTYKVSLAANRA